MRNQNERDELVFEPEFRSEPTHTVWRRLINPVKAMLGPFTGMRRLISKDRER